MIFLINFVNHNYQFEWRLDVRCSRCAEIYKKCKEDMFRYLRDFLRGHDIPIVLEEGGTCINIIEALHANGNEKTILQEVIAIISDKNISHAFVDITEKEAISLIENKTITDVLELRSKKAELRDSYIARGAMTKLLENENSNGLLLCADRHFSGVKHHLEQAGICVLPDSIDHYDWYISSDRIDALHLYEHLS
jgi:hypothetical protein